MTMASDSTNTLSDYFKILPEMCRQRTVQMTERKKIVWILTPVDISVCNQNQAIVLMKAKGCHTTKWPPPGKKLGLWTRSERDFAGIEDSLIIPLIMQVWFALSN